MKQIVCTGSGVMTTCGGLVLVLAHCLWEILGMVDNGQHQRAWADVSMNINTLIKTLLISRMWRDGEVWCDAATNTTEVIEGRGIRFKIMIQLWPGVETFGATYTIHRDQDSLRIHGESHQ